MFLRDSCLPARAMKDKLCWRQSGEVSTCLMCLIRRAAGIIRQCAIEQMCQLSRTSVDCFPSNKVPIRRSWKQTHFNHTIPCCRVWKSEALSRFFRCVVKVHWVAYSLARSLTHSVILINQVYSVQSSLCISRMIMQWVDKRETQNDCINDWAKEGREEIRKTVWCNKGINMRLFFT